MFRKVIWFSDSYISCAEGRLRLLLIETFPILLSSGVPGSSWIAQYKKGAVSIWWKEIIKCINCVSTSLQSHLAYCQGTIRFPWFYVPKIIRFVVNGTGIFAVWLKKIILFSLRSLLGLSSIWAQPCLLKILRLKDQLFFWSVSLFLLLQWIQQSEQQWCWFVYQWWGKTRYWNNLSLLHPSNYISWNSVSVTSYFIGYCVSVSITVLLSGSIACFLFFWFVF